MNCGGDDDFFFNNNNNRQRQLTISTNSSTTSATTTVAKRFQCRQCTKAYETKQGLRNHVAAVYFAIRHRCPNCKSTFVEALGSTSSSSVRTKAVSVRSMPKALSGARLVGRAQGVAHRGRFGSLLQVVRFVCVSVLLLLQLLCVGDVRTHILADHINKQPFKITIKKEESLNDDDDG
jgi:transposase-like protein